MLAIGSERAVAPVGVCRTSSAIIGKPRRKIRWITAISSVRAGAAEGAAWLCIGAYPPPRLVHVLRYT